MAASDLANSERPGKPWGPLHGLRVLPRRMPRPKRNLPWWAWVLLLALGYWSLQERADRLHDRDARYAAAVAQFRTAREADLHKSMAAANPTAPLPLLQYYPAQPSLRMELPLFPAADTATQLLATTSGTRVHYRYKGWVQVPGAKGGAYPLHVYQKMPTTDAADSASPYFIPYYNGDTILSHIRYVDAPPMQSGRHLLIDFNLAYKPYCTYAKALVCPMPPLQNALPFQIRGGER